MQHRQRQHATPERTLIAITQAHYGVSATSAGALFSLLRGGATIVKETAEVYLLESAYCTYHQSIIELGQAKNKSVAMDSSGKQFGRQFVCISFAADFANEPRRRTYALHETIGGGATNLVELLVRTLSYFNTVLVQSNEPTIELNDIKELTLDNCNENMGDRKGFAVLFDQLRELEWRKKHGNQQYLPVRVKGCDDHKANLVSSHFDRKLQAREQAWKRKEALIGRTAVHISSSIIKNTISKFISARAMSHTNCMKAASIAGVVHFAISAAVLACH